VNIPHWVPTWGWDIGGLRAWGVNGMRPL
jgi:hypothetical protein